MPEASTRRVAIVTGASSGIGEATARRLARGGFRVVAAARRIDRLEALAAELAREGAQVLPMAIDLADEAATHALVADTLEAWQRIDVLVNNAGYSPASATEQFSRAQLRHVFEVNLISQLQLVAEVAPTMRAQGGGRIINLGSMAGRVAAPLAVPYSATKAGIEAASHCLRLELAPWKIDVSVIIPGFVTSEAFASARVLGRALREDRGNPYRELMFDLEEFSNDQLRRGLSPQDVALTIERAATARRPRARYYAPRSARMQLALLGLIPDRLRDRLLQQLYSGGPWGARRASDRAGHVASGRAGTAHPVASPSGSPSRSAAHATSPSSSRSAVRSAAQATSASVSRSIAK